MLTTLIATLNRHTFFGAPACPPSRDGLRMLQLCFALSVAFSLSGLQVRGGWEQIPSQTSAPSPRRGVAGIVDTAHDRLVLQGAETASFRFLPDTWFFDLQSHRWEQPALANPSARCHHTFLFDAPRDRGLMFGGFPRNNELWRFDPQTEQWLNITPAGDNPAPRCLHAAALCLQRAEMIVYGGLNGGFAPDLDDTWAYSLTNQTWTLLMAHSPPGRRYGSVMVLDVARDRLILFGGFIRDAAGAMREANDVWTFDLQTRQWAPLTASTAGPSPRQFARGVAVPGADGMVLFGGFGRVPANSAEPAYKNDLWFFDFAKERWTLLQPGPPQPPGRFRHTLLLDERSNTLWVLFGEGQNRHFNDVWRLDLRKVVLDPGRVSLQARPAANSRQIELSWRSQPMRWVGNAAQTIWPDYRVEQSSDLRSWQTMRDRVVGQPASINRLTVTNNQSQAFFRVVNLVD